MGLEELRAEDFAPHEHSVFMVFPGRAPFSQGVDEPLDAVELMLITVAVGAQPPRAPATRRPFSLTFRQIAGRTLPQRVYVLEHPALGQLELFLVPLGPGRTEMLYEAIVS